MISNMEIWMADLPVNQNSHVQYGLRPVVIVSNDCVNHSSPVVSIVPLTSKTHKGQLPTHVLLQGYGLQYPSVAICEQVMAMDKNRLRQRVGEVSDWFDRLALRHALAIQLSLTA